MNSRNREQRRASVRLSGVALGVVVACSATSAFAFGIDLGHDDLVLRWDTTLRYNIGLRAEQRDARVMANPAHDESDGRFDRGDVINNRLDLLTEADITYKGMLGARVSAAGWYDHAYRDHAVSAPAVPGNFCNVNGCAYGSETKRFYEGPSGEVLDAFVFGTFELGSSQLSVKVGRHTVYWGEGLLMPSHSVSYSQGPIDGRKALGSPGAEIKELFLPLSQLSAQLQLSPDVSLAAQYFLEWKPTRSPLGGTYLAPNDFLGSGNYLNPFPASPAGLTTQLVNPARPDGAGNFGLSLRWSLPAYASKVGLYYRVFDDYNPWTVQITPLSATQAEGRFLFARNVQLYGASLATVLGGISYGADLSYRRHAALNSTAVINSPLAPASEGARGNTWHAVVNAVAPLPNLALWDTGTVIAELGFSYLQRVTSNPTLYNGGANCIGGSRNGCSSRGWAGLSVNMTPQYLQVAPGLDLDLPLTLSYSPYGNSANAGGAGNKGEYTYSVGVTANYQSRHEFALRYADRYQRPAYDATGTQLIGGNGSTVSLNDRGYVSLTYKTSF